MSGSLASAAGALGGLVILAALFVFMLAAFAVPLAVVSMARSLRRIREQLEAIGDVLCAEDRHARTGPLGLSAVSSSRGTAAR